MASLVLVTSTHAQTSNDPFPLPIPATDGVITVNFVEFASLPDIDGNAPRMMLLVDEPETGRLFVNDMHGLLYSISYDGQTVSPYLDLTDARWDLSVDTSNFETGLQSFAFHPQFNHSGAPGFGKFYTYVDTLNTRPTPDFTSARTEHAQHTILLEWTTAEPEAPTYNGRPPRELLRIEQPFANHNGGQLSFSPVASPGSADYGLLYISSADGGSGGDPLDLAQNLSSVFGKILRIDPLGIDSGNGQYGIPTTNLFAGDGDGNTLGEIYAFGLRNPQRFGWDTVTGDMFVADIGQNIVEEISRVSNGANLGWNDWEGSFRYISPREVSLAEPRGESGLTYPVVEYAQLDPLLEPRSAVTGIVVYRHNAIPQLENLLLFGDNPSGEVFYVQADRLPSGGQDAIGRILLNDGGASKTLLQLIHEKNREHGRPPAERAELRFGTGTNGQIFLLNKRDGVVRLLVP